MTAMLRKIFTILSLAFALSHAAGALAAEDSPDDFPPLSTNERVVMVPGHAPNRVRLQVTVMTPPGDGPFPLAILNHSSDSRPAREQERYRRSYGAYYFLSRGYAVALPMMRGYAGSEGRQIDSHCSEEEDGLANAYDIDAVADYMSAQPYVDGSRIVVAGASFGGWNTLAYGVLHRREVRGLINFAGGIRIANCPAGAAGLNQALRGYAQATRLPSQWLYGQNDSLFPTPLWHAMFDNYVEAGGKAELADLGKFLPDTHDMLDKPEGLAAWQARVDAFLGRIGLPNRLVYSAYLPSAFPPPTHAAAIDDVAAVPYLDDNGRALYRRFLAYPMPRVFFVAPSGWHVVKAGGFDPLASGLRLCAQAGQQCIVYAVDDAVTWARPEPVK